MAGVHEPIERRVLVDGNISNKGALMHEGRLLSFGSLDTILEQYHSFVRGQQWNAAESTAGPGKRVRGRALQLDP